jgi:hypothetical protein
MVQSSEIQERTWDRREETRTGVGWAVSRRKQSQCSRQRAPTTAFFDECPESFDECSSALDFISDSASHDTSHHISFKYRTVSTPPHDAILVPEM